MKKYEVKVTDLFPVEGPKLASWKYVYLASDVDAHIVELEADLAEQCRLHGAGSEREARQLARIAELEKSHQRYEYVRTLNVPQFQELYRNSIQNFRPFDALVDEAIEMRKSSTSL